MIVRLLIYGVGVLVAVILSNSVTLAIYYSGHPTAALLASAPIGLTAGIAAGLMIRQRLSA